MQGIESALAAFEEKVADAQKASEALSKALKQLRQSAQSGNLADLEKGLSALAEGGEKAADAARSLASAWSFDARQHLANGYADELREEAAAQGVKIFKRDGRLYAFPLLIRIDSRDVALKLGKKIERRLRPKYLVKLLAAVQKRPQRFREERFLAVLYDVYGQITGAEWRKLESGPGPARSLAEIHALLTLLPGSDYPIEEFGRDLLLLDRKPDLRTKDGATFEFQGAALARGSMKRIAVYDENGNERTYIAIRFMGSA